jgi:ribosomal protein S20
LIAKAAKKGVIHQKNASRKIARLSKLAQRPKA